MREIRQDVSEKLFNKEVKTFTESNVLPSTEPELLLRGSKYSETGNSAGGGQSVMVTGEMISGPSFFPDLLVQGLKNG